MMRIKKISIWGELVDPKLNSLDKHYKNFAVDYKENYKFDMGVKEFQG